jgi:hypothetical protein
VIFDCCMIGLKEGLGLARYDTLGHYERMSIFA